ncbi:putative conserved membrane protein [Mycobacterium kansasii 732]|nr:putative conserved membrane protein [Mycobacterium kansasii 732]
MPNAPEPDRGDTETGDQSAGNEGAAGTEGQPLIPDPLIPDDAETETVVISTSDPADNPGSANADLPRERRFTAPGFDAKETQVIATSPEPATEVFHTSPAPPVPRRRSADHRKPLCHSRFRLAVASRHCDNATGVGCWQLS